MKTTELSNSVRLYRELLLKDMYRPGYHFSVPDGKGIPGDPNGCFYADGRHHLMYLYEREGGAFHWGHVSSVDLIHWRHHQDSLVKGISDHGCFSGGAFVDDDGTAYLSFWIFNANREKNDSADAGIGIAWSRPPYEHWERFPEVCIASTEWGIREVTLDDGTTEYLCCADPSNIWKKDGVYYIQTGNLCVLDKYGRLEDSPVEMRGDWVDLFSSADLRKWEHEGRFYERRKDNIYTDESEDDMCPSFLPLPRSADGGPLSDKYLQLFISHNKGCQYYIGDYIDNRFIIEKHGRMSWVDDAFFAPEAYIDGRGRQIMLSWLRDNVDNDYAAYGWSGVQSLPRTLWLDDDGELGIAPVDEIDALRIGNQSFEGPFADDELLPIKRTESCEINISSNPGNSGKSGIALVDPKGHQTLIYYDARNNTLVLDATHSKSLSRPVRECAPLLLSPEEPLNLRVYIDKSVIEIFANNRQAICRRVYKPDNDNLKIKLIQQNGTKTNKVVAYEMMESMPY